MKTKEKIRKLNDLQSQIDYNSAKRVKLNNKIDTAKSKITVLMRSIPKAEREMYREKLKKFLYLA